MPTRAPCPDVRTLQQLLLGLLPRELAESLEEHVATCNLCGETLRSLPGEDALVDAVRSARRPVLDAVDRPVVEGLVLWLKKKGGHGHSVTVPPLTLPVDQATPFPVGIRVGGTEAIFDFLAPAQQSDELGRLGPYRILQVLGAGGMGVVFLAEDPRLDRRVALKAIRPELASRTGSKERFLLEARATAKVEHDHVVTVYEADEARGVPYLTMPLLKGEPLEERLQREGGQPLPLREALRIGREIAEGLAAAHAVGLIHRDIKPGNLWLEAPTGRIKILDFGLARALTGDASNLSQENAIVGTPAYMAPEQARPGRIDARADLFSLGCVLYQMTTGRRPFHGYDIISTLMSVATDTPTPVRELNPAAPLKLSRLIDRLLAKQPEERFAGAVEVAAALRSLEQEIDGRPKKGRTAAVLLLLGVGIAVAASLLALWMAWYPPEPSTPTANPAVVTFTSADGELEVELHRGEEAGVSLDWKHGGTQELTAGEYEVKLKPEKPGRYVLPRKFTLEPGEQRAVRLQLVGEVVEAGYGKLSGVGAVALHPKEGLLCLCGGKGVIALRQADQRKELGWLQLPDDNETPVLALAIAPDGAWAVSGGGMTGPDSDPSIYLWDLTTRKTAKVVGRHRNNWVTGLAFAPDGKRVASSSYDGTARIWDLTGSKAALVLEHGGKVHAVAFSPEGERVATGAADGKVRLWNALGGTPQTLEQHTEAVRSVAFLPDGRELVSASDDGSLIVWDLTRNAPRTTLKGHKSGVTSVAASRDGRRILSGGKDRTVRLWDVASGSEITDLTAAHQAAVTSVAFSADGRYALSAGAEKSGINVRLWRLPD